MGVKRFTLTLKGVDPDTNLRGASLLQNIKLSKLIVHLRLTGGCGWNIAHIPYYFLRCHEPCLEMGTMHCFKPHCKNVSSWNRLELRSYIWVVTTVHVVVDSSKLNESSIIALVVIVQMLSRGSCSNNFSISSLTENVQDYCANTWKNMPILFKVFKCPIEQKIFHARGLRMMAYVLLVDNFPCNYRSKIKV